jgi:hypothetical protein
LTNKKLTIQRKEEKENKQAGKYEIEHSKRERNKK